MAVLEVFGNCLKKFLMLDYGTYRNIIGVFSYVWKMAPVVQVFSNKPQIGQYIGFCQFAGNDPNGFTPNF